MGAIIAALLPVLIDVVKETPALIDSAQKAWSLLTSDEPATDEQQAEFEAAMNEAHAALQASAARQD